MFDNNNIYYYLNFKTFFSFILHFTLSKKIAKMISVSKSSAVESDNFFDTFLDISISDKS
jgi:hypothetical protein